MSRVRAPEDPPFFLWGYSSAGRALEWHSRGQRFDPAYLHQKDTDFCFEGRYPFLLAKNLAYKSCVLNECWYLKNFCQYWKAWKIHWPMLCGWIFCHNFVYIAKNYCIFWGFLIQCRSKLRYVGALGFFARFKPL